MADPEKSFQDASQQDTENINVNQPFYQQRLVDCIRILESIYELPDKSNIQNFGKGIFDSLRDNVNYVISALDQIRSDYNNAVITGQLEKNIDAIREVRTSIALASDMLKREDRESESTRRSYYNNINQWQKDLRKVLKELKEVQENSKYWPSPFK